LELKQETQYLCPPVQQKPGRKKAATFIEKQAEKNKKIFLKTLAG
jgi:hypothetical protein